VNLSAIDYKSRLGKLLRLPLQLIPAEAQIPILQGRLRGKRWIVGSSLHGCWLGSYEYQKSHLFVQTIKPGSVVYDVGAHVGWYTLLAAVVVGETGQVFAFEPAPLNMQYLHEHLRINNISNVTSLEVAVANDVGFNRFDVSTHRSMGRLAEQGHKQVAVTTLDELTQGRQTPHPHFMKIDVEGAEFRVLEGAEKTLNKTHPTIFLATHGADVHQECCNFLRDLGYRLSPIEGTDISMTREVLAQHPNQSRS
jgi:FkbM family methyltransferase